MLLGGKPACRAVPSGCGCDLQIIELLRQDLMQASQVVSQGLVLHLIPLVTRHDLHRNNRR